MHELINAFLTAPFSKIEGILTVGVSLNTRPMPPMLPNGQAIVTIEYEGGSDTEEMLKNALSASGLDVFQKDFSRGSDKSFASFVIALPQGCATPVEEAKVYTPPTSTGELLQRYEAGERHFSRVDLRGADLRRARLQNANLVDSNLSEADLTAANLRATILAGANLTRAKLREADLTAANLINANLDESTLQSAWLRGATFWGTTLKGANLAHAEMGFVGVIAIEGSKKRNVLEGEFVTTIGNTDLSRSRGLETIRHYGPSTIGIDALKLTYAALAEHPSRTRNVEAFLYAAGVADEFLTHLRSTTHDPTGSRFCFISYSHRDKRFADRLYDRLRERGIHCWLDDHNMLPGDNLYDKVDQAIRQADRVLLCCSEASLTSWWVDSEIHASFEREQRLTKERGHKVQYLIPLNLDGFLLGDKWTSGKAAQIRSRFAADFTGWARDDKRFEAAFEKLVRALKTQDASGGTAPVSSE